MRGAPLLPPLTALELRVLVFLPSVFALVYAFLTSFWFFGIG